MVTQLQFMKGHPILISASKDSFVKFWDLETHHCFKTLTGHQTEVWTIALMKDDEYLVTGCGDAELRVYKLSFKDPDSENKNIEYLSSRLELTSLEESEYFTVSLIKNYFLLYCNLWILARGNLHIFVLLYSNVQFL
uniref:WD repeat-containing protein 3-like n=1 Tax=Diabrotica virgifera virgifera TaxID=50390 RepID=A0A6P7H1M8_DIAVI